MGPGRIRTPDQRLRVFVSSTLAELSAERAAVRRAIERMRLSPVMFELGARPYPPQDLYRAYLDQSDIFVGIYWQSYGWIAADEEISGLEDELRLSEGMPRLMYVREPAPGRDPRLSALLDALPPHEHVEVFTTPEELEVAVRRGVAALLADRFDNDLDEPGTASPADAAPAAALGVLQPANPIIGRDAEVALTIQWLTTPAVRMVTLTGPGGVGKSRLALEAARLLQARYRDGVATVLLEALRDPALVIPTIARGLGVRTGGSPDSSDALAALQAGLAGRQQLLVLDNFEHLLDAAPQLAQLLEASPGVDILVTSRAALRLQAERELPIDPLPVPEQPGTQPIEQLAQAPAVRLFLARAQAANPAFTINDDALRAAGEICRRLDGLPLAIELAAARVRLLPPRQLLARLEQRFALLTGGTADMPDRHQTLRATIDWGHDLLDEPEQVALRRLAVFTGGWSLAAAEAVLTAAGPLGIDVLDVLDGLVTKSFVARPSATGPAPRFRMLHTIAEYARERLTASSDLQPTVDAHAAYFLDFAEQAAPELQGPDQSAWFLALEEDHDNLLAALRRLDERGDVEHQLRLTVALGRLWLVHSHITEARHWLEAALRSSEGRADAVRAELLVWAGWLTLFIDGDVERAEALGHEALQIRRDLGDTHGEAVEVLALGNVAVYRGDPDEARRRYLETMALADRGADDELRGRAAMNLGVVNRASGDLDAASVCFEQAVAIMHARGDEHAVMTARNGQSGVALDRGDVEEAERLTAEVIGRFAEVGDVATLLEALEHRSAAWAEQGRPEAAAWLWGATAERARTLAVARSRLEEPLYRRYVDRARQRAAAAGRTAAFEAAWAAGAAAPSALIIPVALEQLQVPLDP